VSTTNYGDPATRNVVLDTYRAEIMSLAADVLEGGNPDLSPEFSDGVGWAVDTLRSAADKAAGGAR
jgi:hypothetical protein